MHTTWGRLATAVDSLATGGGRINERLHFALDHLVPLKATEFPAELQAPFAELRERVLNAGGNKAFVEELGEKEASEVAGQILSWFNTVTRLSYQ